MGSLENLYRDVINDDITENNDDDYTMNNNKIATGKSFKYKKKITGSTPNKGNMLCIEAVVPLKYLSNFWRSF